ncbi:Serine aminopeptidase [Phytophthora infestans]|nr:Serine aminopeptidase [Phytophthora infestans]
MTNSNRGPIGLPIRRVQSRNALAMSAIQEERSSLDNAPMAPPVVDSCSTSPTTSSSSSDSSPNRSRPVANSNKPPTGKATARPNRACSARSRSVAKFEEVEATTAIEATAPSQQPTRPLRAQSARTWTPSFADMPSMPTVKGITSAVARQMNSVRTRSIPTVDETNTTCPPKKTLKARSMRSRPISCFDDSLLDEQAKKGTKETPEQKPTKIAKSFRSRPVPCFDDRLASGPTPETKMGGWKPRAVGTRPASGPKPRMPRSTSSAHLSSSPSSSDGSSDGAKLSVRRRDSIPPRKLTRPKSSSNLTAAANKPAKKSRSRRRFPSEEEISANRSRASSDSGRGLKDALTGKLSDEDLRPRSSSDSTSSKKAMKFSSRPRHFEGKFQNRRGQSLLYFSLFPPEKLAMRGVILYLHGMGDHCRRSTELYERYCEEGFGVITYDLVNHGASDYDQYNTRAHISNFDDFVDDTNDFVKFAKINIYKIALRYWRKHHHPRHPHGREKKRDTPPELPLIISGTSFGALIGLHTVLSGQHKFHAAMWASASIGVTWTPVLWAQWKFAKPLVAAFPTAKVIPAIQHNLRSRNPDFLEKYQDDPLTSSDMITPRSGHESLNAMIRLQQDKRVSDEDSSFCTVPMLFLAGSDDRISDQQATFKFFQRMGNLDKSFKVFDGLYHMIYEEPEREEVLQYLVEWLHKRFPLETRHPNDVVTKLEPSIRSYNYVKAERTEL